jgi:mutator family transposase
LSRWNCDSPSVNRQRPRLQPLVGSTLVVMGATADGDKELLAVHDGVLESEISWKEVLLDLRERGMTAAPEIAVGRSTRLLEGAGGRHRTLTRLALLQVHTTRS